MQTHATSLCKPIYAAGRGGRHEKMFNDLQTENKCQTQQSTITAKLEFNVFSFNLVQVWEEVRFSPRNPAQRYGKRYDSVLELLHTGMGRGPSNKWGTIQCTEVWEEVHRV